MLKNILILATLNLATMLFLTACGNSGGDNLAGGVEIPTLISDRIASQSLVGTYSNGGTLDDGSDDTRNWTVSETQDTFNLRRVGGGLIMTINGANHIFVPADFESGVWTNRNNIVMRVAGNFNANADIIYQIIDGTHATAYGTYILYETDTNYVDSVATIQNLDFTRGYATVGTRTPPSAVQQQTATAIYRGIISIFISPSRGIVPGPSPERQYHGDISMNVNFDSNRVSGEAILGVIVDSEYSSIGTANFASADINGNGFDGAFTLDNPLRIHAGLTNNHTGNYGGNFFGPNAESLVGVMRLNGTTADGTAIGVGGFGADRQ